MSLTKQIHVPCIDTSSLYTEEENILHSKLLKLYHLKKRTKEDWKRKSVNRIIKKYKNKLVQELNANNTKRIVRVLPENKIKNKNIISIFESSLTRICGLKNNEITEKIIIINIFFFQVCSDIVKQGFLYKNKKYIFLGASAGQIRQKKLVAIEEELYNKVYNSLTCGLSMEEINAKGGINQNKFCAYNSLSNSATDEWEDFDIDKSIVVDDFETDVFGTVDFIDDKDYSITRKDMAVPVPHMDGCGIMLDEGTRMVRLPWVKGLLVTFPFNQWLKEKAKSCNYIVKDIYGKEHNVIDEGIRYIFTKSQFKMWKYYDSWEDYKARFKKYNCQACYCNLEEDYVPKATINYQMLQTLTDMTDKEIEKLVKKSVEEINLIGKDHQTTMRLLGATDYNMNLSHMQRALKIYPELMRDVYNKEILKDVKRSLVKKAKAGKVRVNGGYRFLSPDLYAFCEWLFLGDENPKGLLENGEVYCSGFNGDSELACLRSPHLYREWPIRTNVRNEEIDKWFGMTKCIYTSSHDLISKILMFDCDGDKALVIKDKNLISVAKRNMDGIVPLYYSMKKAQPVQLTPDSIYQGMIAAYTGGNIGPISNNISKIWNSGEIGEEQLNVIKWLCLTNNEVIDYAKTLYRSTPPKEIDKTIKFYTRAKLPNFFIQAKDKTNLQVEKPNDSTMNRISKAIPTSKISYCKSLDKFNYRKLLSNQSYEITPETYISVAAYDYWNKRQGLFYNHEDSDHKNEEELYVYQEIKRNIIEAVGVPVDYIVDSLVAYLYTMRKASNKKLLWACFGKEIVENLEKNVSGKACQICGKRFEPDKFNVEKQLTCSAECGRILDNQNRENRR